ncbi:hypothetical protein DFH08DRAFT_827494 [Mycena albidolilacea]|uniref:Uncharacterized protein n=1 Tax=Mycena albidolilacea TaxID=1033008 RepID=A0AAD6YYT3_9AGAR|nr:hypothetical protein DFH08DRAFT_827494 [Mycena albidolilacea]
MYAEPKHIKSLASITSISARTVPKFNAGPQNEALFCTVTQRVFSPLFGAPNCRNTWLQNSQPVPNGFKDKLSGSAAGTHILADQISFARFFVKLLNIRRIRSTAFYRRGRRRGIAHTIGVCEPRVFDATGSSRLGATRCYTRGKNRPGGLIQLTIRCDSANQQHIDDLFLVSLFIVPQGGWKTQTWSRSSSHCANEEEVFVC